MRSVKQLSDLTDHVAVITGGAGHLGRAMASALIELKCHVILVDRDESQLETACSTLKDIEPGLVSWELVDLENSESRISMASSIQEKFGHVDILINNAGFVGTNSLTGWSVPFDQQSIETWRRALEVNLTAPFHLTQLFVSLMKSKDRGSIINISSIYGILGPDMALYEGTGMGNPAAYAASKGGLIQLTRWLATTLAPNVRVNAISPGGIERGQHEDFSSRYVARTPLERMGREEDFLGVVAFLASELSSWVTGQNIVVDGGWSSW